MRRGKFITFEGIDASGKSTQSELLKEYLQGRGLEVISTREPGGCAAGEAIRQLALHSEGLDGLTETLLMFAARREHVLRTIQPALEAGRWVLCDRFTDSTFAYQGGGRGIAEARIEQLRLWVQKGLQPDLTFYLLSPAAASSSPLLARETFESENVLFYKRVTAAYKALARKHAGRITAIKNADGNKQRRTREDIHAEILLHVRERFGGALNEGA